VVPSEESVTEDLALTVTEPSEVDQVKVYTGHDIKFNEATFYKDIQPESVDVQVQLFPP